VQRPSVRSSTRPSMTEVDTTTLLAQMTSRQVEAAIARGRTAVVVPFGALEQHGPHLPLDTDAVLGDRLGPMLAERLDALCAPTIRVGCSWHHLAFAGTLSIRPETLLMIVEDLVDSLTRHGFRRIVLLPTHGGNEGPEKSSGSGTASATSPTTGCGCYCIAASAGRHTRPHGCEAAPHIWRRRAPMVSSDVPYGPSAAVTSGRCRGREIGPASGVRWPRKRSRCWPTILPGSRPGGVPAVASCGGQRSGQSPPGGRSTRSQIRRGTCCLPASSSGLALRVSRSPASSTVRS
jgi:hypothetical protein